jgi:hypothetical protein
LGLVGPKCENKLMHILKDIFGFQSFGQKLFGRQTFGQNYLPKRHLVKIYLPDRQSVKNVLADRHFIKKYLTNRHLDKKYDQQTFGQKIFNYIKGIEMRQLAFRSADVYCQNINNPKCPLALFLYANGKKGKQADSERDRERECASVGTLQKDRRWRPS